MGSESSMNFHKGDIVRAKDTDVGYDEIQKGALYEVADRDLYGHVLLVGQDHTWGAHHFELVHRPGSGVDLEGMKLLTIHGSVPMIDAIRVLEVMHEEGCPRADRTARALWLKSKFECARKIEARLGHADEEIGALRGEDTRHWKERYRLAARLDEANQEIDKLKRDLAESAQRDAKSKTLETQLALALQKAKYSDDAANEAVREMKLAREERQQARRMRDALGEVMGEFGFPWWAPNMQDITKAAEWLRERLEKASGAKARFNEAEIQRLKDQLELARLERDELADELQGELGRKGFTAQVETRAPAGKDIDGTPLFVGDTVVGVDCYGSVGAGGERGHFHKIKGVWPGYYGIDRAPIIEMCDGVTGFSSRFRKQSK